MLLQVVYMAGDSDDEAQQAGGSGSDGDSDLSGDESDSEEGGWGTDEDSGSDDDME